MPDYDSPAPRISRLAIITLVCCAVGIATLVTAFVFASWSENLSRTELWIGRIAFWTAVASGPAAVGTGIAAASRMAQPGWASTVSMVVGPLLITGAGVAVLMTYAV
ncbi:MAG: hypothetical protein Q4G45_06165 [Actinomycetia bacterium]|nr:hypothetical protein [Actinomycetes bacterium]